jgi:hypothetical protein
MVLGSGSIAAKLDGAAESDVLIAAGSAFTVVNVGEFMSETGGSGVPFVKLVWAGAWSDAQIERRLADLLLPIGETAAIDSKL